MNSPLPDPSSTARPCPKCGQPLPAPKAASCPHCGANLKPLFGPVVPALLAFLLGVVALGAGGLGSLGTVNDGLTGSNTNANASGSMFNLSLLCGAAAVAIVVWLIRRK
jgi:hypothetical protein